MSFTPVEVPLLTTKGVCSDLSLTQPCDPKFQISNAGSDVGAIFKGVQVLSPPYLNNVCSAQLGDRQMITVCNQCIATSVHPNIGNQPVVPAYLNDVGPEWEWTETNSQVPEPPPPPYSGITYSCPSGTCGNTGYQFRVVRTSFQGDSTICCLKDNVCNYPDPNSCFSGIGKSGTCDPQYRDVTSKQCVPLVERYCLGEDLPPNNDEWLTRWTDGTCPRSLFRNLYQNCPLVDVGVSQEAFQQGSQLMSQVFDKYQAQGFQIGTLPGFAGYNPAQEEFYQICDRIPGLCSQPINNLCARQTTETVSRNPLLLQWCGCHLPEAEYETYVNLYQINRECTPMCNRLDVIQQPTPDGLGKITCQQSVCLIDNITIQLANTQVEGGVNISQFCGSCAGGTCSCIISDNSIEVANSEIGGGINLTEQCGGQPTCLRTNPTPGGTPSTIEVPCSTPNSYNPFNGGGGETNSSTSYIILLIGILLIILFLLWWGNRH